MPSIVSSSSASGNLKTRFWKPQKKEHFAFQPPCTLVLFHLFMLKTRTSLYILKDCVHVKLLKKTIYFDKINKSQILERVLLFGSWVIYGIAIWISVMISISNTRITKRYMFKAGSPLTFYGFPQHVTHQSFPKRKLEVVSIISQELRMLSSVTLNCQQTKTVKNSVSQLSEK